jgi:hypothetical protein
LFLILFSIFASLKLEQMPLVVLSDSPQRRIINLYDFLFLRPDKQTHNNGQYVCGSSLILLRQWRIGTAGSSSLIWQKWNECMPRRAVYTSSDAA